MSRNMEREALILARYGFRVFPLEVGGKRPAIGAWPSLASREPETIRSWWGHRWDANIGIATGRGSGIVVVDLDGEEGRESWFQEVRRRGRVADTVTSLTGGGGTHLLFRHPGGQTMLGNRQGLFPGVDIRGDGGFIVAPPSVHSSGRAYAWELSSLPGEVPIAPLPGWLLELLVRPKVEAPIVRSSDTGLPAAVTPVLQGCSWLRHCIQDAAKLGESEWYALLGITGRLEDGERLAHQWSKPHAGYDLQATADKLRHALTAAGPATCAAIQQMTGDAHCRGCLHRGRVRSPISLARSREAALEDFAPPPSRRMTCEMIGGAP